MAVLGEWILSPGSKLTAGAAGTASCATLLCATLLYVTLLSCAAAPRSDGHVLANQPDTEEPTSHPNGDMLAATANGPALTTIPPDHRTRSARLDELIDGDSFEITWVGISSQDEIRLVGLNAPELDACFGSQSRRMLKDLLADAELHIAGNLRDRYGRILGDVWANERSVNLAMVEQGGAIYRQGDTHLEERLEAAQRRAIKNELGMWAPDACGDSVKGLGLKIAYLRYDAAGPDHTNPNDEWVEIANESDTVTDLTGWTIRDESSRNRFHFPSGFHLKAGSRVRIFSGAGTNSATELYWNAGDPVWNNLGDSAFLVAPSGWFADHFTYG